MQHSSRERSAAIVRLSWKTTDIDCLPHGNAEVCRRFESARTQGFREEDCTYLGPRWVVRINRLANLTSDMKR